jgi:hypothetical protein
MFSLYLIYQELSKQTKTPKKSLQLKNATR